MPTIAVDGTGDEEVVGGASAITHKSPQQPSLLIDDADDRLPQQPDNPVTAGLLPWEQQLLHQSEQRLDLELEGTLPGMGSKEQAMPTGLEGEGGGGKLEGHSEELFVPSSSPIPDVDEGVGVAIQPQGKGTLPVFMETSNGGGSSSLPMAGGSHLDQRGSGGSVGNGKGVVSSFPDRMAIALQAVATSGADEDDDVVAIAM